jgi:hypothetical protein
MPEKLRPATTRASAWSTSRPRHGDLVAVSFWPEERRGHVAQARLGHTDTGTEGC